MNAQIFFRRLSGFLILSFLIVSCKVTWVPEYNAQLEEQISNAAKATDRLYLDMLDIPLPSRTYDNFKDRYNAIESEINSIKLKNEARLKNADFLIINKNLKVAFDEAKAYHKDHTTLSNGEIKAYQATLAGFWRPLYFAEKGLKGS